MILGILQARMSSTRLPAKVLTKIVGKPMLLLQLERLKRSNLMDKLVVATTESSSDDIIVELCNANEISFFRGSEDDVLDRYYNCAKQFDPDYIVRLTGDDPLTDPELIDSMIEKIKLLGCDAITNSLKPTYPEGLDITIIKYEVLREAWMKSKLMSEREHVTPYIFDPINEFSVSHYQQKKDLSSLRWTVDYEEDIEFMRLIYKSLYSNNKNFSTKDIYELIEKKPFLKEINSNITRNAGLIKSLENDKEID